MALGISNRAKKSEPYNNAIQPAEPRPSHRLLAQTLRRFPQSLSLRAKAFGLVRRLIGRYTDPRKSEMKNEIVWPSAIGGSKKGENAHLRRHPKSGSDSSVRPSVWPLANGGTEERKGMSDCSGIQRLALIQAFGPSSGLRPLADRMKTNIYAEVFDFRSGQEASAKIGLRLGELDVDMKIENEQKQHRGGFRWDALIQTDGPQ